MMAEESDLTPWSEDEQEALRALAAETLPPDHLEDQVVEKLVEKGLIRRSRATHWRYMAAAASVIMALASSFLAGRWSAATPDAGTDTTPRFMLLLYDTLEREMSRDDAQNQVLFQEYSAWAGELASVGRFVDGDALVGAGDRLRRSGDGIDRSPDGGDHREIVVGYFMIRAESYDEALEIAEDCPHLKYDGGVVLRQVGHS